MRAPVNERKTKHFSFFTTTKTNNALTKMCFFLFSFFLCLFLVATKTKTINKHRTPTTTTTN